MAGGLDREVRDAAVRDGVVLHLLAGDPLLVDQEEPPVGEEDGVADQQVRGVHLLVLAQQPRVVLLRRAGSTVCAFPNSAMVNPRLVDDLYVHMIFALYIA